LSNTNADNNVNNNDKILAKNKLLLISRHIEIITKYTGGCPSKEYESLITFKRLKEVVLNVYASSSPITIRLLINNRNDVYNTRKRKKI